MTVLFGLIFLFGHGYVLSHNTSLESCLKVSGITLSNDELYYVTDDVPDPAQLEKYS